MKIMAVDYGDVRTGLAVCDKTEFLSSPIGTVTAYNQEHCVKQVAAAAAEYDVETIVVGLPLNMDGTEGERAQKCRKFAQLLAEETSLPINMWDERQSTMAANTLLNESAVSSKKRKAVIDEVAATLILDNFLQFRRNN